MRLIDADRLKRAIESNFAIPDGFKYIVDAQQTAYDQEKVVEKLETLRKECEDPLQDYCPDYFIDRAVDFVKGGGVNE